MIKPCGGIEGQHDLVQYNESQGILVIDPLLLHKKLKKFFDEYIDILLRKKDRIRVVNFRKKMWRDFSIRVPVI